MEQYVLQFNGKASVYRGCTNKSLRIGVYYIAQKIPLEYGVS